MKIIKKITLKEVFGKITMQLLMKGLPDNATKGETVPLMRVIGIARRYRAVQSDLGESIKFLGEFKATNLMTGEVFMSGACFLPGAIPDLVFGALGSDGDRDVEFAFEIGAHFDESAATKYVYDVNSLKAPSEADQLSLLEKTLNLPALTNQVSAAAEVATVRENAKAKKAA